MTMTPEVQQRRTSIFGVIDEVAREREIDEVARQRALDALDVIGSEREDRFDRVTRLARHLFGVESVLITLMDGDREWFKSTSGIVGAAGRRQDAFCDVTMRQPTNLVVPDAQQDDRFRLNPKVTGELGTIRFYAGHPLEAPGGERIGALCIFDSQPRQFSETEARALRDLAEWVQHELSVSEELAHAIQVQRGLLPKQFLSLPGFDVAGACVPTRSVGGDFYDWYPIGEGAAFTLGDVMGKGVGAALIAATVRGVLRAGSNRGSIVASVQAAASILAVDLDEAGTFVTLFHCRLDMHTGVVRFVDAGHGLTLVIHANGTSKRLTTTSLPLGADVEESYRQHRVTLAPGDTLVSVSDGVLDLFDGTLAALDEVEAIVRRSESAQDAIDTLVAMTGRSAPDDVTAVVVRRRA